MQHRLRICVVALIFALVLAGCGTGPSANGSFDRTLDVSGPIRLDLSNASGDVRISGGPAGKVHIHAEVRARSWLFQDARKQLDDLVSNPPIEQHADTIRIGAAFRSLRDVSIDYTVEVPNLTEVDASVASGAVTVRGLHGPVKVDSASGSVRVEQVDRAVRLNSASGAIIAANLGDELRVSSASGSISASSIKGDVRIHALSGSIEVANPGGRVEAQTASGSIEVRGANNDAKASSASGRISIQGNPSGDSYWKLKTVSGSVDLDVPPSAAFHLTAEAVSGEIRTAIPVLVEEQGRHTLRARVGTGGGRVEIRTVSGQITVRTGS